jgi:hypothetical protein
VIRQGLATLIEIHAPDFAASTEASATSLKHHPSALNNAQPIALMGEGHPSSTTGEGGEARKQGDARLHGQVSTVSQSLTARGPLDRRPTGQRDRSATRMQAQHESPNAFFTLYS